MHAPLKLLAAALLSAGVSMSSAPLRPSFAVDGVERTVGTTSAQASVIMTRDGSVTTLNWTQTTPGIDGLGAGNDVFRVAVLVDGVTACYLDVACDAVRADYSTTCSSADFVQGNDVDVKVTSNPCLTPAAGFPAFTVDL